MSRSPAPLHLFAALSDEEALAEARRRFPSARALRVRDGASRELADVAEALTALH